MSAVAETTGKRTNWKEVFDQEVLNIGNYVTKKAFYKDFAARNGVSWETVKKYHAISAIIETAKEEAAATVAMEAPLEPAHPNPEVKSKEQYPSAIEKLKQDKRFVSDGEYYVGCYAEFKVKRVEPRFVKAATTDGFDTESLLYIAEISNHYVANTEDHFMFGDIFIAEVLEIDARGRLKIATKGLFIRNYRKNPPKAVVHPNVPLEPDRPKVIDMTSYTDETFKNGALADKLAESRDSIVLAEKQAEKAAEVPQAAALAPVSPSAAAPVQSNITSTNNAPELQAAPTQASVSREIEQVRGFVSAKLGYLSEGSEKMLQELIDKHGIVNFTMAMAQVLGGFECDLGIYFAKEIDAKLSGGL